MNDKEKLRMAKNLVKLNNKKIKLVLKMIEDEMEATSPTIWTVEDHTQYLKIYLSKIKEILETGKLPDYN
jgi:hypothetical protein